MLVVFAVDRLFPLESFRQDERSSYHHKRLLDMLGLSLVGVDSFVQIAFLLIIVLMIR